jgi:signal-transduction protein with cAMP-binding, CBS, and nucleotidyltransferase domain
LARAQLNLLQSKSLTMRTAKDILQQKGTQFNFIKFDKTVLEAIGLMKTENISYLIVMDKNDKYIGVFSERDYAHKVILEGKQSANTKVSEIMTTNLANASLEDSTSKLMLLINNSKARYIPVFDGNNFKGIITIHDLMREAMADYEKGKKNLDAHELAFLKEHGA